MSTLECAKKISNDKVDILVDLTGYTHGMRSDILALLPASIKVNFLGHVGTQGNDWINYAIADKHVVPMCAAPYWNEKIVRLPNFLLSKRSIPAQTDKESSVCP